MTYVLEKDLWTEADFAVMGCTMPLFTGWALPDSDG
jgi:hypothetical protein